ncbi:MAG TPA: N-acetyltransferase [Terriglobales bacterium]|nr:N-acetyltransferase [Terriglobales bacterium]
MIRDATPDDFETLWSIDQECFAEGISYSQPELHQYMRRRGAFTLVKEDGRGIAAFLVAESSRRRTGHIITIDVQKRARRRGCGSELLLAAEQRLRAGGCGAIVLEVAVDNATAIRFYKRHGYSVVKTIPRYYLDSVDALLMGKPLPRAETGGR